MKLLLVTVALDPETGGFPTDPLAGVEGEILSVVEHFFHFGGLPHLLLVVHHRPLRTDEDVAKRNKRRRVDPMVEMSPEEKRLYEALRAWRAGRAEADGVPVYVLFNNEQALTSLYSHLMAFDTYELRREYRQRQQVSRGRGRAILQPGEPRWLLEERSSERACREPQQGRSLQAQRLPGVSRGELDTARASGLVASGPEDGASRSATLCPGIDQTSVPRSGPALQPGTEPPQPGGGALRVAAGHFSPRDHAASR